MIVTKDRDFISLAKAGKGHRVVCLGIGNMATVSVLVACARAWPHVIAALQDGEVVVEVRQDADVEGESTPTP